MAFPSASAIEAFIATQLDYIVIGGGVAGLPIANRLTEDPSVKVGILEAGLSFQDDPLIDIPRNVALNNGNPKYDWMLSTSPQFGAAERSIMIFRGKGLGGSSVLNYMAWDRGSKEEYDAWNALVDGDGWNWDSILPFLVKVEDALPATINPDLALRYSASEAHVLDRGIPRDEAVGSGGPVKIRYNELNTDVTSPYVKAWNILGQRTNSNPWGGDASGLYSGRLSIDEHGKRVTATSAYYTPVASRPNLSLLTGAQVTKILFESELVDGNRVAIGVEFTVDGKIYTVSVSKEVILSAGVIQTPQILELSGVGDSKRLEGMGITTLVHLPGVGENLHDHPFSSIHYQAKSGVMTYDELSKNAEFAAAEKERYEKSGQGWMASNDSVFVFTALDKILDASVLSAKIKKVEEAIDAEKNNPSANQLTLKQHSIQLDWLKKGGVPHMEFILFSGGLVKPDPNASYFVITSGLQHPFSRGCVHIQSTDPLQAPLIDPGYLTHEFDVFSLLAGYRAVEKLAQTPPLVDIISQQIVPATTLSDEEVIQYIRQGCVSGAHQMGTAAMARRDLGGVVGSNLKVHGTANLRVADASIIPLPVAAHIQATVYAIGEKAAELIKSKA